MRLVTPKYVRACFLAVIDSGDAQVTTVFAILILLIVATPALAIVGGTLSTGYLLAIAALAVVLIALTSSAGELRRVATLWKPIAPIAILPWIWMLAQLAPVPAQLAHSAWAGASAALGRPVAGSVTVDIGATLLGLCQYSLSLAVAIIATAVALDRRRARTILFVLMTAAALTAAVLIGLAVGISLFNDLDLSAQRPQMSMVAVLGLVVSCATAIRIHHSLWRRGRGVSTLIAAAASVVAIAICLSAVAIDGDAVLLFAAIAGVLVLVCVEAIQRYRLGPWGRAGIAAAAALGLLGFLASIPTHTAMDPSLVLSSQPHASIAIAEHMLSDAKWVGTGVGTFAMLLPIYRDVDDAITRAAPTAAASIAIEMGRPMLWLLVISALIGAVSLVRRALALEREYIHAATGAACIVAALIMSFVNAGILGLAAALLASAICGLAVARSRSWSV
jgi:hypothetical protein